MIGGPRTLQVDLLEQVGRYSQARALGQRCCDRTITVAAQRLRVRLARLVARMAISIRDRAPAAFGGARGSSQDLRAPAGLSCDCCWCSPSSPDRRCGGDPGYPASFARWAFRNDSRPAHLWADGGKTRPRQERAWHTRLGSQILRRIERVAESNAEITNARDHAIGLAAG